MKALKLRTVLRMNAAFSFFSGLIMLILPNEIAQLFELDNPELFYIIGTALILFALYVTYVSERKLHNNKLVQLISYSDFGWVLGSLGILVAQPFDLSLAGNLTIAAIAFIVLLFGLLQLKFSRS